MQRAIRTALLTAIGNIGLYYSSSPQAALSQALDWGSDADIFDRTRGGLNSMRGSKALDPLLRAREQGARTSEGCVRNASRRGHHYVGA
jgi:hypothetical protein